MLATMGLLAVVYAAFVAALVLVGLGPILTAILVGGVAAFQFLTAQHWAMATAKAHELAPQDRPGLHAALARLCMHADVPVPRLAVSSLATANAFAIGGSRGRMTVCVTDRLLDQLTPAEVEAILAHELAHVINRDAFLMTIAGFFAAVAAIVVKFGWRFGHWALRLAVFGASLACFAVSWLLLRALSRQRELTADHTAALITGRPAALASALLKLDRDAAAMPEKDLRALAALQPLFAVARPPKRWGAVVATHPPTSVRVAALERLERELQRP
ncbi:MAG: peptidase Ste24p [Solirubrobacterales bacterium]|jgi:heat shock protein HtpX|nr:peptidase Ste24p [Solirubrobacterales bacterium]